MRKSYNSRAERRMKRNKVIIGIFLSALMILSIAGIIAGNLSDESTESDRAGITFNSELRMWQYVYEDNVYYFSNLPEEVLNIVHDDSVIDTISATNGLVLMFDPSSTKETLAILDTMRFDLTQIWMEKLNLPVGFGLIQNDTSGVYDFPVISCNMSDSQNIVVNFIESQNQTSIGFGGSPYCIEAYGYGRDYVVIRDFIVYSYLGVI